MLFIVVFLHWPPGNQTISGVPRSNSLIFLHETDMRHRPPSHVSRAQSGREGPVAYRAMVWGAGVDNRSMTMGGRVERLGDVCAAQKNSQKTPEKERGLGRRFIPGETVMVLRLGFLAGSQLAGSQYDELDTKPKSHRKQPGTIAQRHSPPVTH